MEAHKRDAAMIIEKDHRSKWVNKSGKFMYYCWQVLLISVSKFFWISIKSKPFFQKPHTFFFGDCLVMRDRVRKLHFDIFQDRSICADPCVQIFCDPEFKVVKAIGRDDVQSSLNLFFVSHRQSIFHENLVQ